MKKISKEQYKDELRKAKAEYIQNLENIRKRYKNSGDDFADVLNSIYIRKVYYAITWKNLKRDGIVRFFWRKFWAERKYRYFTALRRPANLESAWGWPRYDVRRDDIFDIQAYSRYTVQELSRVGDELLKLELKRLEQQEKIENAKAEQK